MSVEPAELRLDEDGTFAGTTGCREIDGEWQESGDQIVFTTFSSRGECSDHQQQDGYIVSIGDGFTFEIEGDTLTIDPRLGEALLMYRAR
jgi:heat shock protein HslJ